VNKLVLATSLMWALYESRVEDFSQSARTP